MANALIKTLLANVLDGMEKGSFTCTPEEEAKAIEVLSSLMADKTPLSKAAAADFLHLSLSTFDRRITEGKIPQGRKLKGFKELIWYKSDLKK